MALLVLALLLIVRAVRDRAQPPGCSRARRCSGVAFNVKLLESLVALPGARRCSPASGCPAAHAGACCAAGGRRRGVRRVALSWLTATLLAPGARPPVRDRLDQRQRLERGVRLQRHRPARRQIARTAGHRLRTRATTTPTATQSERDHIPIVPPSPTRLLARVGPLSGQRLGLELLIALLLGIPALILGVRGPPGDGRRRRTATRPRRASVRCGCARAVAAGLALWMLTGHRPVQPHGAPAPALRGGLRRRRSRRCSGIGVAWAAAPRGRLRTGAPWPCRRSRHRLLRRAAAVRAPGGLVGGARGRARAQSRCAAARAPGARRAGARRLLGAGTLALSLTGGAGGAAQSRHHGDRRTSVTDAGFVGALPGDEQRAPERLPARPPGRRALRGRGRVGDADRLADRARTPAPMSCLPPTTRASSRRSPSCKRLIAAGQVRYAFLNTFCGAPRLLGERRLLGARALDPCARHGRLAQGGPADGRGAVAAAWSQAVSGPEDRSGRGEPASAAPARPAASRSTPSSWARGATARCCA